MSLLIQCACLFLALAGGNYVQGSSSEYERSNRAGGWLKYHAEPATWEEARLRCHAEGAVLASPITDKLRSAIETFIAKKGVSNSNPEVTIFIGVHATFSEGDYTSVEGVPLERLAITWAPREPDNHDNSERCLAMTVDYYGAVADTRCDTLLPYVCYKKDTADKEYRFDYEWSEQAGGWLKYHVVPSTWENAYQRCNAEGAVFASPITHQLGAAIVEFVQEQEDFNEQGITVFTGIQKKILGYNSAEGKSLKSAAISWSAGEPDNVDNSENCLAMFIQSNGTMADTRCDRVLPYVCYKKQAKLTMSACGTIDSDYALEPKTGSCYKFHNRGLPWSKAFMTCAAEGGYLAIINNDVEAAVIKKMYSKYTSYAIFAYDTSAVNIGFHDWGHYGTNFMTIHGESLDDIYHNWGPEEPNNYTNTRFGDYTESCGAVSREGRLNDHLCNGPTAFICEKKPNSLFNDFKV